MPQPGVARAPFRQVYVPSVPPRSTSGAELLALCETASVDGTLRRASLEALRAWLERGHGDGGPGPSLVREIVERVLADGRISPADLRTLEEIFGPSLHGPGQRPGRRAYDGERPMPLEREASDRLRNEIVAAFHFIVAHCQGERLAAVVDRHARPGEPVFLLRDRGSRESPNAVKVRTASGRHVGFVPERWARELAPLLDRGARYRAHLTNVIRGEHARVLTVRAWLYAPDAVLGIEPTGFRRLGQRGSAAALWLLRLAVGAMITSLVALVLRHG